MRIQVYYNDAAIDVANGDAVGRFSETGGFPPTARLGDKFLSGDPMILVLDTDIAADTPEQAAAAAFELLNINHPDGWSHRSMSSGDVVAIPESKTVLSCESVGWKNASLIGCEIDGASDVRR